MTKGIKKAIEEYQCPGCVCGHNITCFEEAKEGVGCGKHYCGFMISGLGSMFLGMPKGFNRLGLRLESGQLELKIFTHINNGWNYKKFNIPVWKYRNKKGHTLIRGLSPRLNHPFLHIILEDDLDKINCLEITEKDIKEMD